MEFCHFRFLDISEKCFDNEILINFFKYQQKKVYGKFEKTRN